MLNTPCLHHAPLQPGQAVDLPKLITYHRNRAAACRAAAEGSFGWRRSSYLASEQHHLRIAAGHRAFLASAEADEFYQRILGMPELYCAGIAKIVAGTEPHWISNEESKS